MPVLERKTNGLEKGRTNALTDFLIGRRARNERYHLVGGAAEGIRLPVNREAARKRADEVLDDFLSSLPETDATA
jgi:hypothetical protein